MARDTLLALLTLALTIPAVDLLGSPRQQPGNATPGDPANVSANATPAGNLPAATPSDPGAVLFSTDTGIVLHAVKPGSVADYEAAIVALQGALSKASDPETQHLARGWRVFKAVELDAKANPLYVHLLQPAVSGVDYRPSQWLDKLLQGAPPELLARYRDAFALPPSKLALTEFAHMSKPPVAVPTNSSPGNATAKKPPGT